MGTDQLIEQFKHDWAAGARPSVDDLLAAISDRRVREHARQQLEDYLANAPTPDYPDHTLARMASDPTVQRAASLFDDAAEAAGPLIRRLRWQQQIRLDRLAEALITRLELPPKPRKVKRYLHELENGLLDTTTLSRRLIDTLAAILNTTPQILDRAARASSAPDIAAVPAYERSYDRQPPFSAVPHGYEPAVEPGEADRDAIDELFDER